MTEAAPRPARSRRLVELGLSALVLVATVIFVGAKSLVSRLHALDGTWVAIGVSISVAQLVLLAARWWFVAMRLGVPLPYGRAFGEYYLATLLNFVVPFGAFGDALRGFRHADRISTAPSERPLGRAILAVLLDRASGQIALWAFVLVAAPSLLRAVSWQKGSLAPAFIVGGVLAVVAIAIGAMRVFGPRWAGRLRSAAAAGGRVLLSPANMAVHLPLSLVLVATHIAQFMVAARAIHLELDVGAAVRFVPAILAAAGLPSFMGGFGAREAAAAGLYHLTGLQAADGAAISFVYGSMGLVASVPGILALPWRRG